MGGADGDEAEGACCPVIKCRVICGPLPPAMRFRPKGGTTRGQGVPCRRRRGAGVEASPLRLGRGGVRNWGRSQGRLFAR